MILGLVGMPTQGFMTELDTSTSLWESVANEIRGRIERGELRPGARLDSQRDLCVEFNVSRITIRRAFSQLATEGFIHTSRGRGTFVSERGPQGGIPTVNSIGLVLRDLTSPFFVKVIGGIERYTYDHGFSLLLSNTSGQMGKEEQQIAHFRRIGVAGIVVASMHNQERPPEAVLRMHEEGFPYVMVSYVEDESIRSVGVDHEDGGAIAGRHLYDCGYRTFGYLNAERTNVLGNVRKYGFMRGLAEAGADLPDAFVLDIELEDRWDIRRFEKGYAAAEQFLDAPTRPEAMFIYNDQAAYGFIKRLQEAGVRIPDDLAVIGFDGIDRNDLFDGVLTTVRQPMEEIGRLAVDVIRKLVDGREAPTRTMVEPHLTIGSTTAIHSISS